MDSFRQFVNPPAQVRPATNYKLYKVANDVVTNLQKLINFNLSEWAYIKFKADINEIFPKQCGKTCKFIRKYAPSYKGGIPKQRTCGGEGCAFFIDNIVIKLTDGPKEYEIASKVKGRLDIVPVLDATKVKVETRLPWHPYYLIAMKKLNTNVSLIVDKAGNLILHFIQAVSTDKNLLQAFTKFLDLSHPNEQVKVTALQLMNVIVEIYQATGHMLHADIKSANVGTTPQGKMQLFDLGFSGQFDKKRKTFNDPAGST